MLLLEKLKNVREDLFYGILIGCIVTVLCLFFLTPKSNDLFTVPAPCIINLNSTSSASRFHISSYPIRGPVPWSAMNKPLRDAFTLNGQVEVGDWYLFGDLNSIPKVIDYTDSKWGSKASRNDLQNLIELARQRSTKDLGGYCPNGPRDIYAAVDAFPVKGRSTLVIGTLWPWVEAILYANGAKSVATVDFNKPIFDMPEFRTMSIDELDDSTERWDAIFSYSSLEHDGLGRYGDPLHPNGDLERMQKIKELLAPGGRLYVAVPIGFDRLFWNAHRIYGRLRFPLLTEGWKVLGNFSASEYPASILDDKTGKFWIQPVFVLALAD